MKQIEKRRSANVLEINNKWIKEKEIEVLKNIQTLYLFLLTIKFFFQLNQLNKIFLKKLENFDKVI